MSITFFNKRGTPIAYTEDNCNIFLFGGEPVAYIYGNSVYHYNGKHLGFFKDGWIRDNRGFCVLFSRDARDGPKHYTKDIGPVKSKKQEIPRMAPRSSEKNMLLIIQEWSKLSFKDFFNQ